MAPRGNHVSTLKIIQPQVSESDGIPDELRGLGMTLDEMRALSRQITIAVPFRPREGVNSGICINYGMWEALGTKVFHAGDHQGGFIEIVRAGICRKFLDSCKTFPELKYLVMVDNDQSVNADCLMRLARHDLPVVSGVVCSISETKGVFACIRVKTKSGAAYFPTLNKTPRMPTEGLVEIHQAGAGLMCIRRDVLESFVEFGELPFYIPEPVRRNAGETGDLRKSEDVSFCDTCEKYGIKRYADLSVRATHYKMVALAWPEAQLDPNLRAEDWDVQPHDTDGW